MAAVIAPNAPKSSCCKTFTSFTEKAVAYTVFLTCVAVATNTLSTMYAAYPDTASGAFRQGSVRLYGAGAVALATLLAHTIAKKALNKCCC